MKTRITMEQAIAWQPCPDYPPDRVRQLFGRRKYMTLDRLRALDIPVGDKLWCLLHEEVIPAPQLHLLACEYAEHALVHDAKWWWLCDGATVAETTAWVAWRAAVAVAGRAAAVPGAVTMAWEAERDWQLQRAFEAAEAAER